MRFLAKDQCPRTGHHCTQPLMDFFEIPGTVRASFAFYNTKGFHKADGSGYRYVTDYLLKLDAVNRTKLTV